MSTIGNLPATPQVAPTAPLRERLIHRAITANPEQRGYLEDMLSRWNRLVDPPRDQAYPGGSSAGNQSSEAAPTSLKELSLDELKHLNDTALFNLKPEEQDLIFGRTLTGEERNRLPSKPLGELSREDLQAIFPERHRDLNATPDRDRFLAQPIDSISAQEIDDLFPEEAPRIRELAQTNPKTSIGDMRALAKSPADLEAVHSMLHDRPDLTLQDVTKKGRDGGLLVDPSLHHAPCRDCLLQRTDLKPLALTHMGAHFAKVLRQPGLAHEAFLSALDVLKSRSNIQPVELEHMLTQMVMSVGGAQVAETEKGATCVVDMFKNAGSLLKKRPDLKPHQLGRMARDLGKLGCQDDKTEGARQVAQAFGKSCRTLERAGHLQPDDIGDTARVMKKHFPGKDSKSAADRLQAFERSLDLLADHPGLKAEHIDGMLTQAKTERPGLHGKKLLDHFEDAAGDYGRGQNPERFDPTRARPQPRPVGRRPGPTRSVRRPGGTVKPALDRKPHPHP